MTLVSLLNGASALFASIAAYFWYTPSHFPIQIFSEHIADELVLGQSVVSSGSSPDIDELGKAMIRQSKLSARAAVAAAGAAVCQVLALVI